MPSFYFASIPGSVFNAAPVGHVRGERGRGRRGRRGPRHGPRRRSNSK